MADETGRTLFTFSVLFLENPIVCNAFICDLDFVNKNDKRFAHIINELISFKKNEWKERNKVASRLTNEINNALVECN